MNKPKFTPGPWRVNPKARGVVETTNGRTVAACSQYTTNADNGEHVFENLANAEFIASAPDIYRALDIQEPIIKAAEAWFDAWCGIPPTESGGDHEVEINLYSAIINYKRKARGE